MNFFLTITNSILLFITFIYFNNFFKIFLVIKFFLTTMLCLNFIFKAPSIFKVRLSKVVALGKKSTIFSRVQAKLAKFRIFDYFKLYFIVLYYNIYLLLPEDYKIFIKLNKYLLK